MERLFNGFKFSQTVFAILIGGVFVSYSGETLTTEISGLPISTTQIKNIYVTFHTLTTVLVEKTLEDCRIKGEIIECELSQEESLKLGCGPVTRSVIVITKDGARFERSNTDMVVMNSHKREVLT